MSIGLRHQTAKIAKRLVAALLGVKTATFLEAESSFLIEIYCAREFGQLVTARQEHGCTYARANQPAAL